MNVHKASKVVIQDCSPIVDSVKLAVVDGHKYWLDAATSRGGASS